jgi:hypothetical protein
VRCRRFYLAGGSDAAPASDARAALLKAGGAACEEMACLDALDETSTSAFVEHAARLQGPKDVSR